MRDYDMLSRNRYLKQGLKRIESAVASIRLAQIDAISPIDRNNIQLILDRLIEASTIAKAEIIQS